MAEARQHPPIDSELVETVWPTIVESFPPLTLDAIAGMREMIAAAPELSGGDLTHGGRIEAQRRTIKLTPAGPALPAIILRPADRAEALPCLYYTANGGKIIQSPGMALGDVEQQWVVDLGLVLVSISPRVGPEDPHPAQIEDAYAGLVWVSEHADELGIDRGQHHGLWQEWRWWRRRGHRVDGAGSGWSRPDPSDPDLPDDRRPGNHRLQRVRERHLAGASNRVGWGAILGDAVGGPDVSPYAAPARATDLAGLPPTYIEVGGSEVFRDEDIDYATRLGHAGVPTELHVWVGGFHGFEIWAPDSEIGRATLDARTSYLRRAQRNGKGSSEAQ